MIAERNMAHNALKKGGFLLFVLSTTQVLAAPQVNSVTQQSSGGELQLVISGSGFGEKSHPNPLYYFDFDEDSKAQNVQASAVKDSFSTNGTISADSTPYGSGQVLRFTIKQDPSAVAIPGIDFDSDRLYVYFNRRYSFSIADSSNWGSRGFNLKSNRIWGDTGNNIYIGYQGKEGNSSGRIFPEYTAEGGATWVGTNLPQVEGEWTQEEIVYKASDIGVQNGIFDLYHNGNSVHDSVFRMRTSDRPDRYSKLYFDQISNGTNENKTLYIYYDNIYIDDTFQRVYLSNAPTFDEAKERLVQVPLKWSDNSVTVKLKSGNFSPSSSYIYVVDANGDVNKNGARLCQSDCPSPPNPPKGIGFK
ncbi:hypothetical protein [Marinobacter mangrovi]|uniref:hypothetical protein n=1 Tax=Marinobacter mangrovi TaxID=2803918 RepID=UPI001933BD0D|nr:hypothetical protein [Marinobacter mangrovi]